MKVYRAFPEDSDLTRTSGAPPYSTAAVPTRVDSPADVAVAQGDSAAGSLSFTVSILGPFTALNSVLNGIHPKPSYYTGGDGPVTGEEVAFNVTFSPPLGLAAGHYFFVPQVSLTSGDFFWLSAARGVLPTGNRPTSRRGFATPTSRRTGCASEPTSSAARRRRGSTPPSLSPGRAANRSPFRPHASHPPPPAAPTRRPSRLPAASRPTASARAGRCRAACP